MEMVMIRNLVFLSVIGCGFVTSALSFVKPDQTASNRSTAQASLHQADMAQTARAIDASFEKQWEEEELQCAPRADDLKIARRISLALTGAIPSLEDIRRLEAMESEQRIEWWISSLLETRRCTDYMAERLARAFVGTENGPFLVFRRGRFVSWVSDRLYENYPYDELTRRLLADTGLWTDSPPVNFVSVTIDNNESNQPDPIRLAARTSRAFIGLRIDCLQCHDDNLGTIDLGDAGQPMGGTQQDFHQLAAFFSEVNNSVLGINDFEKDNPYTTQYLDQEEEVIVETAVPYGKEMLPRTGTLRQRLAVWVTHPDNRPFARTIVNRVWAMMFGKPLIEPIDHIPLHDAVPEALDILAADFVANGYDLRRLVRIVAQTEAFQRSSRAEFEITTAHETAWAAFPLTRIRPEQIGASIVQATSLTTIDDDTHVAFRLAKWGQESDFVKRYGDRGEYEFDDRGGTIPQRLVLMNGKLAHERAEVNPSFINASSQLAAFSPKPERSVEAAYLAVLSRSPTPKELSCFSSRLEGANFKHRSQFVEDLYWVLLNSSEFSWNH